MRLHLSGEILVKKLKEANEIKRRRNEKEGEENEDGGKKAVADRKDKKPGVGIRFKKLMKIGPEMR
jgi:hypothetical protein